MSDLISRSALREEIENLIGYSLSYEAILNAIDNAPTVAPQAFINGIVEIINKNGITTIDELLETLKGGAE